MDNTQTSRIDWIDQVKGFAIFLVVYGHNFPITEKYIYSFHMPLFIMVAGFFHPKFSTKTHLVKRIKQIVFPYFVWATFLFLFWFFLGRKYGESINFHLSPLKNFFGIFYAQGGRDYMDWGIPSWFLPAIFVTYLMMYVGLKIESIKKQLFIFLFFVLLGFLYTRFYTLDLFWSINVAAVSVFFYGFGYYIFPTIKSVSKKQSLWLLCIFGLLSLSLYHYNTKIDMYRSIYGYEWLFLLNGLSGSLFIIFFFKRFPVFGFLGFVGKFSLLILVLQLLAMTFIKFVHMYIFGHTDFAFSEWEKLIYSMIQIVLIIPVFLIINKYLPVLNGGFKKI